MNYAKIFFLTVMCFCFFQDIFAAQSRQTTIKECIEEWIAVRRFKSAFKELKNLQNKIQKNRAENDNNSWAKDKQKLKNIIIKIDGIIKTLSKSAHEKLNSKIQAFNVEKQDFLKYETEYDAIIAEQTLRMVTQKQAKQSFINVATKMRAALGIIVEDSSSAAACAAVEHACSHGANPLPDDARKALIGVAPAADIVNHCKQKKEALAAQDEDGLTPALRGASYGNVPLFQTLSDLEHHEQNELAEKIYAQARNAQVIGCLLAFDYGPCVPSDRPARSYFVHSPHYSSFSCYPFVIPKAQLAAFQVEHQTRRMILGVAAYRLTNALEVRAQSCPNVFAVDNCAVRERINGFYHEYQQRLPLVLTRDAGDYIVPELRELVAAYLATDFPVEKQALIAPVIPKIKVQTNK